MMKDTQNQYEETNRKARRAKAKKSKALLAAGALALSGTFFAGTITGSLYQPIQAAASEDASLPTFAEIDEEQETIAQTSNEQLNQAEYVTGLPDVSDVVAECLPSVVSITNTIEVTTTSNFNIFSQQSNSQSSTQETEAYGSGVIIGENDEELLIVTNNHVAVYDKSGDSSFYQYSASSKMLTVTFADGSEHEAHLKGADEEADLAVIAVSLEDLTDETKAAIKIATIGDSDSMRVGQGVIAIGNALGLGQTTTIGYVSALNREVTVEDGYTRSLMQVDAAINGGNSGGGLFNGKGELIGINSAKYSSVGVEGIGYAIPISSATDIIDELKEKVTKVALEDEERGYLGILGTDVNSAYVSNYGYPAGAQIIQITEGSPAAQSGLQLGDIITAVNGETISSYDALRTELSYYAPGETVTLTCQRIVGRQFEEQTIEVTLTSRDSVVQ
jgi:serine protease Do